LFSKLENKEPPENKEDFANGLFSPFSEKIGVFFFKLFFLFDDFFP
jgi:hypothetical protein